MKTNYTIVMSVLFAVNTAMLAYAIENEDSMKGSPKGSMAEEVSASTGEGLHTAIELVSKVSATAIIKGTQEGSKIFGEVTLAENQDGVLVITILENVPGAQKHGIHIHEKGSCDDQGKAAGGHFNPGKIDHGFLPDNGIKQAHAGDMGNIIISEQGSGVLTVQLPGLSLTKGKYKIIGKAIILHEKEDDFGQPTGNAGGRIACGIIESIE